MYIAMEYVEGVRYASILRDKRRCRPNSRSTIARQISEALVYLHGERVVHRDIKPENILVTASGLLKIMDFGIALDEDARRLTWSGLSSTIGTPDYMAPEQISGRRGDARTDIYALGTMLYEMLTGHLPYSSDNVYEHDAGQGQRGSAAAHSISSPGSTPTWRRSSSTRSSACRATVTRAPPSCCTI